MTINEQYGTFTPTAGTAAVTIRAHQSILTHVFIKAATGITTFDMTLTDLQSNETFCREDNDGELNEFIQMPARGNYTLTITNASADELFNYTLNFLENA